MTCRERLAIDFPRNIGEEFFGGCSFCPSYYGYANRPEYCDNTDPTACTKCWDREVEEVENGIKSSGDRTVNEE